MTNPDEQSSFRVTLKDVYEEVKEIKGILDDRLRKVEAQVAAQWVVVGLVVVAIGGLLVRVFTPIQ